VTHLDDRLAAFVDGELGHHAREKVLAHLADCADCRAEADFQRRLKATLTAAPTPGPSGDLMSRLLAMGDPQQQAPPPTPPPGPAAAAEAPRAAESPARRPPARRENSRPQSRTGPRAGRPAGMPVRAARPPVYRRRITFAAAGAFSMMAIALSTAFVPGGPGESPAGQPAAPTVERQLIEQADTAAPGLTRPEGARAVTGVALLSGSALRHESPRPAVSALSGAGAGR
jgi:hypothetical protein